MSDGDFGPLRFRTVEPMLAAAAKPFHDDACVYEAKLDGIRCLAFVDARGRVRLQNRKLRDMTPRYPDVAAAVRAGTRGPAVLDGEVVVLVDGVPDFARLVAREGSDPSKLPRLLATHPVDYYAFDLLWDGRDLRAEPLHARRARLEEALSPDGALHLSPHLPGNGVETFRRVVDLGFEGVVAKRRDAPYVAGRSPLWRKVKRVGELDAVVGGWTAGAGRRAGTIGSLLLGLYGARGLVYVGRVGSGLADADLEALRRVLPTIERASSPFAIDVDVAARFAEPLLVAHVAFQQLTADGRLRGPAFKGFRTDKPARDCTLGSELPAFPGTGGNLGIA